MKKLILGITVGLLLSLFIGKTYADWQRLTRVTNQQFGNDYSVDVIYDSVEHVNCYVSRDWMSNGVGTQTSIFCMKASK